MRKIWVKVIPWNKDLITTALENGADGVLIPNGYSDKVKELGKITTIAEDGDLKLGKDIFNFTINCQEDEGEIIKLGHQGQVILECSDWTIIPLENLIAQNANIIAQVNSLEDAETAFGILEKGVNKILLDISDPVVLQKALKKLHAHLEHTQLEAAVITEIKPIGMGDRVCIDTCTAMQIGEGMLVGNSSSALFLVHSESISNPYVAPRPFRVNAGPIHAYTRVPGGKTRYLSELQAGDAIYIVDYQGKTTAGVVGRLKIEKRPLMLIKAQVGETHITTILQNAETIRLTSSNGQPISIVNLQEGDEVLVAMEKGGRHFGHKIDETITEK